MDTATLGAVASGDENLRPRVLKLHSSGEGGSSQEPIGFS